MIVDTNDKDFLNKNKKEIERSLRDLNRKPAKDIITHKMLTDDERYKDIKWSHKMLAEFARLLGQINDDIKNGSYDSTVLDELFREVKTIRDRRFMVGENKMRAIIIAAATVTSLKHSIAGVSEVIDRWDIAFTESRCTKCSSMVYCKSERCDCVCHNVVRKGSTKGVKWHMNTHEHCKDLYNKMEYLMTLEPNDLCETGSELVDNIEMFNLVDGPTKKTLMRRHINADKCAKCQEFVNNKDNKWLFFTDKDTSLNKKNE
uniref:Uncharacterized protein n=1 Tax=Nitrosopumivirus cobalaminus TaxID=3158414 RepID=A0AAU7N644_9VIRU